MCQHDRVTTRDELIGIALQAILHRAGAGGRRRRAKPSTKVRSPTTSWCCKSKRAGKARWSPSTPPSSRTPIGQRAGHFRVRARYHRAEHASANNSASNRAYNRGLIEAIVPTRCLTVDSRRNDHRRQRTGGTADRLLAQAPHRLPASPSYFTGAGTAPARECSRRSSEESVTNYELVLITQVRARRIPVSFNAAVFHGRSRRGRSGFWPALATSPQQKQLEAAAPRVNSSTPAVPDRIEHRRPDDHRPARASSPT